MKTPVITLMYYCRFVSTSLLGLLIFVLSVVPAVVQADIVPPQNVRVMDTPSDGGQSLTVVWAPAPYDGPSVKYHILVGEGSAAADSSLLKMVAELASNSHYVRGAKLAWWVQPGDRGDHLFTIKSGRAVELKNGAEYVVAVAAVSGTDRAVAVPVRATPAANWINLNQLNNLILAVLFGSVVFFAISRAKRKEIFLRRIAGLEAVDEAIGRATELGKPVLYLTGAHDMNDPSTIAAAVPSLPSTDGGGVASPSKSVPQHTSLPVCDWIAQLIKSPTATIAAVPSPPSTAAGGVALPRLLSPQQMVRLVSAWIAQFV